MPRDCFHRRLITNEKRPPGRTGGRESVELVSAGGAVGVLLRGKTDTSVPEKPGNDILQKSALTKCAMTTATWRAIFIVESRWQITSTWPVQSVPSQLSGVDVNVTTKTFITATHYGRAHSLAVCFITAIRLPRQRDAQRRR